MLRLQPFLLCALLAAAGALGLATGVAGADDAEYIVSGLQVFSDASCSFASSAFFSAGSGSGQCQPASGVAGVGSVKAMCSAGTAADPRTTLQITTFSDASCEEVSSIKSTTFPVSSPASVTCETQGSTLRSSAQCVVMQPPSGAVYNLDGASAAAGSLRVFKGETCDSASTLAVGFQWVGQCVQMGDSSIRVRSMQQAKITCD